MKKLMAVASFLVALALTSLALAWAIGAAQARTFQSRISPERSILFLGDSHIQTSLNDDIIHESKNLAREGEGYFYSFLKVRRILRDNPQVDTVVLGFASAELTTALDARFDSRRHIESSLPRYWPLLEPGDFLDLFAANPIRVAATVPMVARLGLFDIIETYRRPVPVKLTSSLGGFVPLEISRLDEAKTRFFRKTAGKSTGRKNNGQSSYQERYLLKIYELTQARGVSLILLNTPVHPLWADWFEDAWLNAESFARSYLPNARILDHSRFEIPEENFRDLGHLASGGSRVYSEFLRDSETFGPPPPAAASHAAQLGLRMPRARQADRT